MKMNIPLLFLCLMAISGCREVAYLSPAGYDFQQTEQFIMPEALKEISGIAFSQADKDNIYAIQDEDGKLFYFHPGDQEINHVKFAKKGDYEDIAFCGDRAVILRSDGTLYTFSPEEGKEPTDVKEWKDLLPKGEYEGLAVQNSTNRIFVLCKHCPVDKKDKKGSGYIFTLSGDGSLVLSGSFQIDLGKVYERTGRGTDFRPSALAFHPLTKEWYVLSSVNKCLVITDENWAVKEVFLLDPKVFNQPEGLAFDTKANLYISDEGSNTLNGSIYKFIYQFSNP